MKKLALVLAIATVSASAQAAVYHLTSYDVKNAYTGGVYVNAGTFTSGSANVFGPVFTFTNVSITTTGPGAVAYSGGSWTFDAINNTLTSSGAGTCTGSCTGIFAVGAPGAALSFISNAAGPGDTDFQVVSPAGAPPLSMSQSFGMSTTAPVPVPAAAWLMGSGLVGLAGIARRRKMA